MMLRGVKGGTSEGLHLAPLSLRLMERMGDVLVILFARDLWAISSEYLDANYRYGKRTFYIISYLGLGH